MLDKLPKLDPDKPIVRIWRHRNFALFMAGIGPYYITSWMQRVGVGWLAWELTHSTGWLGAVAAADLAPMLVLGPIGGAVADRWEPMRLMRLTQALLAVQAVVLSAVTLSGLMRIELLIVLALITGTIMPFYTAARLTLVPSTVPREDYPTATALDGSFFHSSRFFGPMVAAVTIPLLGVGGTFVIHVFGVLTFFCAVSMMTVAPVVRRRSSAGSLIDEVVEGMRYIRGHAGLLPVFAIMTITSTALRPIQDMLPGFAGAVFQSNAVGLSLLVSGMGVGAMVAAISIAMRGNTRGLTYQLVWNSVALSGAALGFVATSWLFVGVLFSIVAGFSLVYMSTSAQALAQTAVADEMRGRVMGFYSLIYRGTPAIGALVVGLAAELIGLRWTFAICAVIVLAAIAQIWPQRATMAAALEGRRGSEPAGSGRSREPTGPPRS